MVYSLRQYCSVFPKFCALVLSLVGVLWAVWAAACQLYSIWSLSATVQIFLFMLPGWVALLCWNLIWRKRLTGIVSRLLWGVAGLVNFGYLFFAYEGWRQIDEEGWNIDILEWWHIVAGVVSLICCVLPVVPFVRED